MMEDKTLKHRSFYNYLRFDYQEHKNTNNIHILKEESIKKVGELATLVESGKALFTDEYGRTLQVTDEAKEKILIRLKRHFDVLQDDNPLYYEAYILGFHDERGFNPAELGYCDGLDTDILYFYYQPEESISTSEKTKLNNGKRKKQLHHLIWHVYQSLQKESNQKVTSQKVWQEIKNNHTEYDEEKIIQEVTSDKIHWISHYDNECSLKRRSIDSLLSKLKKTPPF